MPWAAAIALGAIVAPPDAAAAVAILSQVKLPHRMVKVLEGESLLNDASALLIYRIAVGAVVMEHLKWSEVAPTIALALVGSVLAGLLAGRIIPLLMETRKEAPSAIIVQFAHHLHGLDRRRASWPLGHSHHRRLRHHNGAHGGRADAGAAPGAVLLRCGRRWCSCSTCSPSC